ncbi:MAG: hypothetical protein ACD_73C00577G0003 [uncultured bacterium]|nr:MAG: hypothetical protein ACD_73C00577G0003 [uncultured bacterium]
MNLEKQNKIYEGKAKILYSTNDEKYLICYFKDDATAFNNLKKGTIVGKGILNNAITARLFEKLNGIGIENHFVEKISDREMIVKKLQIIPIEVIVRNVVAGSLSKRMGIEEGVALKFPIIELCYKKDELGDPFINDEHCAVFDLCHEEELKKIKQMAHQVNKFLISFFDQINIRLVDFKLEFGRYQNQILLGDEITPDGCRLWDKTTNEKLDKDRFRRDLGGVEQAYQLVYEKVMKI